MISYNLRGIKIYVSFAFMVFITLLSIFDKTGLLIISFFAILFHELGHLFIIKSLGIKNLELMFILGSVKVVVKDILPQNKMALIALGGPLMNIILTVFLLFNNYYLVYFGACNIIVFLFNMLPIKQLDGGDILKYLLNLLFKNYSEKAFNLLSLIFTLLFTAFCGTFFIIKYYNPTLLIVGIYLIIMSIKKV